VYLRCQAIAACSEAASDASCRLSHQNCIGSAEQANITMAAARGFRSLVREWKMSTPRQPLTNRRA